MRTEHNCVRIHNNTPNIESGMWQQEYQNVLVFTYGVREQQQLKVLYGGDGAVSNQLHQGCRQRVPLKHMSICIYINIREQRNKNWKRQETI